MFAILNKSERLVTTHLGDALPPGVPVAVSEVTMEHPSMQEMSAAGLIEVVEIQDPPPPEPPPEPPANGDTMTGGQRTQQPTPTPTPAPQPRPNPPAPQPQPQANKAQ
jgi:outer membrane biosynthesis protein TonB